MAEQGLALDTETWALGLGLDAPPIVCGSAGWLEAGQRINGTLLDKFSTLETFVQALEDPAQIIIGANIAGFDLPTLAVELARMGVDAMPTIFEAFEQGRIYCLQNAEALHAIANGHLGKDPSTGAPLKNPETGKRGSYSLELCVYLVLGRLDAKANDEWRLRYRELEGIPLDQWPQEARDYPIDDARNTLETALAQAGFIGRTSSQHDWGNVAITRADGTPGFASVCTSCGGTRFTDPCKKRRANDNIHEVANQTYSHFCLKLGGLWGFHVDQRAVDIVERNALRNKEARIGPFITAGIIREDGTEDRSVLKRMVAIAHGATDACPRCTGTGKVPSQIQKTLQCTDCKGRCQPWKSGGKIKPPTVESCARCSNTGRIPHPVINMVGCIGEDFKTKTCDGTGFLLPESVPRSEKEGVSFGRDTCFESGDEFLMSFGVFKEDEKVLKDYVPWLRSARLEDPATGQWRDIPLTLSPNPILDTLRVSYRGYVQLLPRAPGYINKETDEYIPSIRECITARPPRYELVEVPDDYVLQPGEELYAA